MGRISRTAAIAPAVAVLARRQHGVVAGSQMVRLGLSDDVIETWAREGRLHRVHRGVYATGDAILDPRGRILAAVLACGAGGIVSHRSAGYLLGIGERSPLVVDLIPTKSGGRAIDGVKAHLVPYPARHEWGFVR